MAAITICSDLEPRKIKSDTVSTVSPSIYHKVVGPDAMIFILWMLSFKPTFSLSSFTFIKRLFSSSSLSAIRVVSCILPFLICNKMLSTVHGYMWCYWWVLVDDFDFQMAIWFFLYKMLMWKIRAMDIYQNDAQTGWKRVKLLNNTPFLSLLAWHENSRYSTSSSILGIIINIFHFSHSSGYKMVSHHL